MTPAEVKKRWDKFAEKNNLRLATWCDLDFKAKVIAEKNGGCPCAPEKRPWCPCPEALSEVRSNGECFCRVFVSRVVYARNT